MGIIQVNLLLHSPIGPVLWVSSKSRLLTQGMVKHTLGTLMHHPHRHFPTHRRSPYIQHTLNLLEYHQRRLLKQHLLTTGGLPLQNQHLLEDPQGIMRVQGTTGKILLNTQRKMLICTWDTTTEILKEKMVPIKIDLLHHRRTFQDPHQDTLHTIKESTIITLKNRVEVDQGVRVVVVQRRVKVKAGTLPLEIVIRVERKVRVTIAIVVEETGRIMQIIEIIPINQRVTGTKKEEEDLQGHPRIREDHLGEDQPDRQEVTSQVHQDVRGEVRKGLQDPQDIRDLQEGVLLAHQDHQADRPTHPQERVAKELGGEDGQVTRVNGRR